MAADGRTRQEIVGLLDLRADTLPRLGCPFRLCRCADGRRDRRGRERRPVAADHLESNADVKLPFFQDVLSLPPDWLYQSKPYFSPETNEWVLANGTAIVVDGRKRGVLYYELVSTRSEPGSSSVRATRRCGPSPSGPHWSPSTVVSLRSLRLTSDRARTAPSMALSSRLAHRV